MKFRLKAFIAAVTVCVLIISAKYFHSSKLSAQLDKGICRAVQMGHIENLYIGSSMFRKGINLHEDDSRAFIIYYNGLDLVHESLIVEQLLRDGLKIDNLYVDMYAFSAASVSWLHDLRLMFDAPSELKLKVWRNAMNNPRAEMFATPWEMFVRAENGIFLFWPVYKKIAETRYYRGGYALSNINSGRTLEELSRMNQPSLGVQAMNSGQKSAVVRIIELCRQYGVNVIFAETPKYSSIHSDSKYLQIMNEYIGLLNEYNVKYIVSRPTVDGTIAAGKNAYVYEFPHGDPALFEDYVHLSTEGSRRFMRAMRDSQPMR